MTRLSSPSEEIQAAIDKLTTLKAESTPGPWHKSTDDLTGDVDVWHDQEVRSHVAAFGAHEDARVHRDAQLTVTLHATIDAQLAILQTMRVHVSRPDHVFAGPGVELVRAINGGA